MTIVSIQDRRETALVARPSHVRRHGACGEAEEAGEDGSAWGGEEQRARFASLVLPHLGGA